jgi:hypothetical protein
MAKAKKLAYSTVFLTKPTGETLFSQLFWEVANSMVLVGS